ncbi:MAG: WecB/TagA/CpsF family glycosyltransferase [Oscillospiraceae bacterium]|nr:WecB/TagA/CpsF family glycosyltransferase [Oscillospiraceae bacterium]
MKADVLGVSFDAMPFADVLEACKGFLEGQAAKAVFTPNPEAVMMAQGDPAYRATLNSGDLVIPDGIGIVLASRLGKVRIKERVTGYDLSCALLGHMGPEGQTAYFFGSAEGVAERAGDWAERAYPGLRVVGRHHGMGFREATDEVVGSINGLRPNLVLVGLGMVNQETWIRENAASLDVGLLIGVGGVLDHFAGDVRRAPKAFRAVGMEWLYRLFALRRLGRQKVLVRFVAKVIGGRLRRKGGAAGG